MDYTKCLNENKNKNIIISFAFYNDPFYEKIRNKIKQKGIKTNEVQSLEKVFIFKQKRPYMCVI